MAIVRDKAREAAPQPVRWLSAATDLDETARVDNTLFRHTGVSGIQSAVEPHIRTKGRKYGAATISGDHVNNNHVGPLVASYNWDNPLTKPDVLGPELVVNGDFSDGMNGWEQMNGHSEAYKGSSCKLGRDGGASTVIIRQNLTGMPAAGGLVWCEFDLIKAAYNVAKYDKAPRGLSLWLQSTAVTRSELNGGVKVCGLHTTTGLSGYLQMRIGGGNPVAPDDYVGIISNISVRAVLGA